MLHQEQGKENNNNQNFINLQGFKQSININYNNNIINNNFENPNPKEKVLNKNIEIKNIKNLIQKCTCTKTACIKKYCACFSFGKYCEDCDCKNCENRPKNLNNQEKKLKNNIIQQSIYSLKNQRIICNCTKSNCLKKYCECFKQGSSCNKLCRCLECKNKTSNINDDINANISNNFINNENNINLTQNQEFSFMMHDNKLIDFNNPINYKPEAFVVFIKKGKLQIEDRFLDLNNQNQNQKVDKNLAKYYNETPKFSNRKRTRNSSNMKTCPTTNSSSRKNRVIISNANRNIQKKRLQLS